MSSNPYNFNSYGLAYWTTIPATAQKQILATYSGNMSALTYAIDYLASGPTGTIPIYPSWAATPSTAQNAVETTVITSPSILQDIQGNTGLPVNSIATGLESTGDFLSRLTQASTWIRITEVILGLLFLAVGIAKLTGAIPLATKAAAVLA
jgi:hypothetical protein